LSADGHSRPADPSPSELLSSLSHWLSACSACGACTTVCPVFTLTRHEGHTARGHLLLIDRLLHAKPGEDQGSLPPPTARFRELLFDCLRCGNCATVCPSHIPTVALFEVARMVVSHPRSRPPWWRLARWTLLDPHRRLPPLLRLARPLLPLTRWLAGSPRPDRRIAASLVQAACGSPPTPACQGGDAPPSSGAVPMLLFSDCVQTSLFPQALDCLVGLAAKLGIRLRPVRGSACCGAAGLGVGDLDFLQRAIARNLALFGEGDTPIVVDNPTCLEVIRSWYPRLAGRAGERFASRTVYGLKLILDHSANPAFGRRLPLRVALHDACHRRNFIPSGDKLAPLLGRRVDLLQPGLLPDRACCGFGGSFLLDFPAQAETMGRRLAQALLSLKPDLILSTNPACALSLKASLLREGADLPVLLPSQLLHWLSTV